MPWYLYLALQQLIPRRGLPSIFGAVATLGVALGVAVLVGVQAVMAGFGSQYREKIVEVNGHLRIENSGRIIYGHEPLLDRLQSDLRVLKAEPYAHGVVMMLYRGRPVFPFVRSWNPWEENPVVPIAEKFLIAGDADKLDDDSVVLGSGVARQLGAYVGDTVEVLTPYMLQRLEQEEILLARELRVAGIFEAGWDEIDRQTVIGTLPLMQDLYGMESGIHGIAVKLADGVDEFAFASEVNAELSFPMRATTWKETFAGLLWVLDLEKNMLFFLMLFVFLVAAYAISATLFLTAMRKQREIGLLGAMGSPRWEVAMLYTAQGVFVGLVGTLLGIGLAVLILSFRDPIIDQIARLTDSRETLQQFYQFAYLPVDYQLRDFAVITGAALLLSVLGGLAPAWWAASQKPANALRSEV